MIARLTNGRMFESGAPFMVNLSINESLFRVH